MWQVKNRTIGMAKSGFYTADQNKDVLSFTLLWISEITRHKPLSLYI